MRCPRCGTENKKGSVFCMGCGTPLNEVAGQPMNEAPVNGGMSQPMGSQEIPPAYRPITMWGYFGYAILFSIPLIGLIMAIIFAAGGTKNINLRNFARAQFCWLILAVIIGLLVFVFSLLGYTTLQFSDLLGACLFL